MDQPARRPTRPEDVGAPAPAVDETQLGRSSVLANAGVVTAALTAANLLGYGLNLLASHRLGPSQFGVVAALLGVVVVVNVAALAVQAVVARRVATEGPTRALLRLPVQVAVVVGCVTLAAVPLLVLFLDLGSPVAVLWTAVSTVPLVLIGGQVGVLQGRRRFSRLAAAYVIAAVGRLGGGIVGMLLSPSPAGVLAGTAVGATVSWAVLIPLARDQPSAGVLVDETLQPRAEVVRAGLALLALFLLTNLDLLAARHYLTAHDAGLYAVGAVVAKGAFWLPSAVPVLLLPHLAHATDGSRGLRLALAAVATTGALATTACAAFGGLVVTLVGGSAYDDVAPYLWLFALAGSLFAVAQVLLYSRLARTDHAASVLLWLVLGGYATGLVLVEPDSPTALVLVAVAAAATLATAGCVVEARRGRGGER